MTESPYVSDEISIDFLEKYEEPPLLLVISAPSGAGKSTICRRLLEEEPSVSVCTRDLEFSVSTTTRSPRKHEVDGSDYHFVDDEEFNRMLDRDLFLEWAEVHGERYGTSRGNVREAIEDNRDVMLEIDVQGAKQIKEACPAAVLIFISPPSIEELENRLRQRDTESDEEIQRRLSDARDELESIELYDYVVINEEVEQAVNQIRSIRIAEKCRLERLRKESLPGITS